MKVILSRKGFDSSNGGIPSPIIGKELLSMPIPSDDALTYADLRYKGITYQDILADLAPNRSYNGCHLDPDLFAENRPYNSDWQPAFGQVGASEGILRKCKVDVGDIFLFFGWFRNTMPDDSGRIRFVPYNTGDFYNYADLQVIYGYMEVGKVIDDPTMIKEYYWHPHASAQYFSRSNNTLYLPKEHSSLIPEQKGYGRLTFNKDRVLTRIGGTRAVWSEKTFFTKDALCTEKKNSAKNGGVYFKGRWQELVLKDNDELTEWVKKVIKV